MKKTIKLWENWEVEKALHLRFKLEKISHKCLLGGMTDDRLHNVSFTIVRNFVNI